MACFASWLFRDDVGNTWALGMSPSGQLTLSQVIPPNPAQVILSAPLRDVVTGNTVAIFVTMTQTGPYIDTKPVSVGPIGYFIPLTRAGVPYWLQVGNGQLFASPQGSAGPADPVVGQLYNADMINPSVNPPNLPNAGLPSGEPGGWLPVYSQPAGLGTPTFPQQAAGSPSMVTGVPFEQGMGMNVSPCGHWQNAFTITFGTVGCQTSAFILCSLCGYLIQIITPASLIHSDPGFEHISS